MKWASELPTVPGYYWWKIVSEVTASVVDVFGDGTFYKTGDDYEYRCDFEGGEWCGPLEAPL